jgi:hypothetical protein
MKNLENIPKNHPFKVPDGYFNELPMVIQSRIADQSLVKARRPYARFALQYALPVVTIITLVVFILLPEKSRSAEDILASVETEDLIAYLEQSDLTTDEIIQAAQFDTESVQAIEDASYFDFDEIDLDEIFIEDFSLDTNNN